MKETFKLKIPTGIATGIGNALRQVAMGSLKTWAPIAVYLGQESSLLSSPNTVEDTPQIIGEIKSVLFKPKFETTNTPIHILRYEVRGSFKFSDLKNEFFDIIYDEDREFIHTLGDMTVPLRIYVYNGTGNRTNVENRDLMWEMKMDLDSLLLTSSRHIIVDTFNVKNLPVQDQIENTDEELTLEISSRIQEPKVILNSSMDTLVSQIQQAKGQLNAK